MTHQRSGPASFYWLNKATISPPQNILLIVLVKNLKIFIITVDTSEVSQSLYQIEIAIITIGYARQFPRQQDLSRLTASFTSTSCKRRTK